MLSLLSSNLEILTTIFSNMCVRFFDKLPKITKSPFSFWILFLFVFKIWLLMFAWIQVLIPCICCLPSDINLLRIIHFRCNFQSQNFPLSVKIWFQILCYGHYNSVRLCFHQFSSVQYSVMFDSLQPHGLQHAKLLCPSPSPRAYSNSRLSRQ